METQKRVEMFLDRAEYYLSMVSPNSARLRRLKEQMKCQLTQGEIVIRLGIDRHGQPLGISSSDIERSVEIVCEIAESLEASVLELDRRKTEGGFLADILVRKTPVTLYMKIGLVGPSLSQLKFYSFFENNNYEGVDFSTQIFKSYFVGFDEDRHYSGDFHEISRRCKKVLNFVNYPSDSSHSKKLIYGMSCHMAEYFLFLLGPETLSDRYLRILSLLCNIQEPVIILSEGEIPSRVREVIYSHRKTLLEFRTPEDTISAAKLVEMTEIIGVFILPDYFELLLMFLNLLPAQCARKTNLPCEFYIEKMYWREGLVVGGIPAQGKFEVNKVLEMGPDCSGEFQQVQISCIQVEQQEVFRVNTGQFCSFKVNLARPLGNFRKGMVLIDKKLKTRGFSGFECELKIIYPAGRREITKYYRPLVNIKNTRQCAEIEASPKFICGGDSVIMRLRFLKRKEYVSITDQVIVHDTFMTAVGRVVGLLE